MGVPGPPCFSCATLCVTGFREKCPHSVWGANGQMTTIAHNVLIPSSFFKRLYLFIFREKGMEEERDGEKPQCVVASHAPPTGDLAHNPGMCPDWDSNW